MLQNRCSSLTLVVVVFLVSFSGIRRHDVPEKLYLELGSSKQFECVGQVFIKGKPKASCVLIGSKYVLSAAHVFMESDSRLITIVDHGHSMIINKPTNQRVGPPTDFAFEFNDHSYSARQITVFPAYLDSATQNSCDIALIELTSSVADVDSAQICNQFDELHSDVVGVGYGASGPANDPGEVKAQNKKMGGENVVDSLGGYMLNGVPTTMLCDFDSPDDSTCNKMGSAKPLPLEYLCSGGDSGGGLFRKLKDGWQCIGICSGVSINTEQLSKSGYYGQIMEWTRVSAFQSWIEKQISHQ